MVAFDMLNHLHLVTQEIYPAMSLELCKQLHMQFQMYFDMLNKSFEQKTM